jgi:hypothetical protein
VRARLTGSVFCMYLYTNIPSRLLAIYIDPETGTRRSMLDSHLSDTLNAVRKAIPAKIPKCGLDSLLLVNSSYQQMLCCHWSMWLSVFPARALLQPEGDAFRGLLRPERTSSLLPDFVSKIPGQLMYKLVICCPAIKRVTVLVEKQKWKVHYESYVDARS